MFDVVPLLEIDSNVEALTVQLQDMGSAVLCCPHAPTDCAAPTPGIVFCTCEQWLRPYSLRRRCCHLPVCGGCMQRILQFRLGLHIHSAGSDSAGSSWGMQLTSNAWQVQSSHAVSHVSYLSLQQVTQGSIYHSNYVDMADPAGLGCSQLQLLIVERRKLSEFVKCLPETSRGGSAFHPPLHQLAP